MERGCIPIKAKTVFTYLAISSLFILTLFFGEETARAVRTSLETCAASIIPSLFPYLVLSELVGASGLGPLLGSLFSRQTKKLFRLPGSASSAVVLGSLCGFPVGARTAVSLYEKGELSKREAERLLCFCNNTGPGFLIAGIGASFFGNVGLGILFYAAQLLSALIIGVVLGRAQKGAPSKDGTASAAYRIDASIFTDAVSSSAKTMLPICGYIVFFSYLCALLGTLLSHLTASAPIRALVFGMLELSSGALAAADLFQKGYPFVLCAALCAFFVGWSGLSVHAQTASVCRASSLSLKAYIKAKFIQGILCASLVCVYILLFRAEALPAFAADGSFGYAHPFLFSLAADTVFIFAIIKIFIKKCSQKGFFMIS